MKKIGFFVIFCFLVGCGKTSDVAQLQEYRQKLLAVQAESVQTLQDYYSSLEEGQSGMQILALYHATLADLQQLSDQLQEIEVQDKDFHIAVGNYLSGLQAAFLHYEAPVITALGVLS